MVQAVWDLKSNFATYKDETVFDCMIAEFLLSEGRFVPTCEATLLQYGVQSLEGLAEKQMMRLADLPKLQALYQDIELPLVAVLWQMEQSGILLNTSCLQAVGEDLAEAITKAEAELKKEMEEEINLNSSVQIGNYLAEKVGVPLAKTKTGRYATNESEIAQYAEQFPVIKKLLTYRELSKLRSTYVDSLISKVDAQSRVHTSYNQVAVSTGRLASSNPNLQNIPVTSLFGQQIKSCFTAKDGHILLSFDYSQQELRILAHLTQEEKLIEAFQNNKDVHRLTASQLFHVGYDEVTKKQRQIAKTINFGIVYGMSKYGMSLGLGIPVEEADAFIQTFFTTYPKIKSYYDQYLQEGKKQGFVETLLGRRRYVFEYPTQKFIDNNMRRVLINYPIQGTAADLMKKAMVQVYNEIVSKNDDIHLLLQIHDDLVFEVPSAGSGQAPSVSSGQVASETLALIQKIRTIMCSVYPLAVPIDVDVKIGKNWGEMEKLESAK